MKWARKAEKNYVVLSSDGKLHQGIGQGSPMNVMDNVDAGMILFFRVSFHLLFHL